jgi:hypothetical protein
MVLKGIIKLYELDRQLHKGSTGNARILAKKVGVSRSTLFNLFEELKNIGAEIDYDNRNQTYFYKKEIRIVFAIGRETDNYLMVNDLKKIIGGHLNSSEVQKNRLLWGYFSR